MTLGMLVMLQAVLGFDNLLYISLESKRAPAASQKRVRTIGIALAVVLRIVLLFVLVKAIDSFQTPLLTLPEESPVGSVVSGSFNLHAIIVLFGGVFILYTALKEIMHLLAIEDLAHGLEKEKSSEAAIITAIVLMNLVFSFDSILSAMALTKVFWVMATAIIISGILMIALADGVSEFLKKNRLYEVLGLFVLLIVGVMLMGEGGHLAHLHLFNYPVEPLSKTTFYFTIVTMVLIDVVQGRYQKKLLREQSRQIAA
ncbi:Integral membrane protein TerC family protein [Botrimarina colliarenosi]|uniref:Integral membrane protein TerC family protein n=2 Tax=Botrimarina colliarenosi TaxID=2528001 RepID=A0A5C6AKX2_9BACT|nr:Integral membrane protein TerC family protein [Botrimarina colliarenosi]